MCTEKSALASMALQKLKKRIRFRATHRGTKEADLLISEFVEKMLKTASPSLCFLLEKFLHLDDQVLIDILSGHATWPPPFEELCMQDEFCVIKSG